MTPHEDLFLRRVIVAASAAIYWGGVFIQSRRVRRQTGRSPNLRPRGLKERFLWVGWLLVIAGWLFQPLVIGKGGDFLLLSISRALLSRVGCLPYYFDSGGLCRNLVCYTAMGSAWRIGIDPTEKTVLVAQGHSLGSAIQIYLFQAIMLVGTLVLLPRGWSVAILLLHFVLYWGEKCRRGKTI
jgi:hypothetical protein